MQTFRDKSCPEFHRVGREIHVLCDCLGWELGETIPEKECRISHFVPCPRCGWWEGRRRKGSRGPGCVRLSVVSAERTEGSSLASGFFAAAAFWLHSGAMSFEHSRTDGSMLAKQGCGLGQGVICTGRKKTLHVESVNWEGQWALIYPVQKLLSSTLAPRQCEGDFSE